MILEYSRTEFNEVSINSLLFSIENPYACIEPKYRVVSIDLYKYSNLFSTLTDEEIDTINYLMISYRKDAKLFKAIFNNALSASIRLREFIESLAKQYVIIDKLKGEYSSFAQYLIATIAKDIIEIRNKVLDELQTDYTYTDCVNGLMFFGINKYGKGAIYTGDWGRYEITEGTWR